MVVVRQLSLPAFFETAGLQAAGRGIPRMWKWWQERDLHPRRRAYEARLNLILPAS
jgi:hypothetical protein